MIDGKYDYFAFISYKEEDAEWAKWLQHKLENEKLPIAIREENPELPEYIRPIYEYKSEAGGGSLENVLLKGLTSSKYLIVICSPRSGGDKSQWINNGIRYFVESGLEENIIPFIVEGKPKSDNLDEECFPNALLELKGKRERRGININEMGRDAAAVKVVSTMFDVKFDVLWQRHERAKEEERRRLKEQNDKLLIAQSRFVAEKANQLVDEGDSYLARLLALKALPKDLKDPDRPYVAEAEAALRNATNHNSAILRGHNSDVIDAVFSHNGNFILSFSKDETIRLWESKNGRCIKPFNNNVEAVSFLSDNTFVTAKPYCTKELQIWDFEKTEPIEEKRIRLHVTNRLLCFSYDSSYLFAVRLDELRIWKTENGELLKIIKREDFNNITSMAVSPNNKRIALGFKDFIIRIIDIETENYITTYKGHEYSIDCLAFSPKGDKLVSSSWSTVLLWDIPEISLDSDMNLICKKYEEILGKEKSQGKVNSLSFNSNGEEIIVTRRNTISNTINLWDIKNRKSIILHGHTNDINNARFSPKDNIIVTASSDKTIRLWDCHNIIDYKTIPFPSNLFVWKASFSSDCKLVATIDEKVIYLWDRNTGEYKTLEGHENTVSSVEFSPDGEILVSTSRGDGTVRIWNVDTGDGRILDKTKELAEFAVFSSDGKYIVTASDNDNGTRKNLLKLWNVDGMWSGENKPSKTFECENCIAMASYVSKEGKVIALDVWGNYYEWDISQNNNSKSVSIKVYDGIIVDGMIDINSNSDMICFIAGMGFNTSIYIWDRKKRVLKVIKEAHRNQVQSVKFNSSGDLLVSTSIDKTIKVWNIASGICLKTFYGHTNEVKKAAFSKDKEHIISISSDNTIRIWDFPPLQKLINDTQTRFKNRELTPEEKKKYYLE